MVTYKIYFDFVCNKVVKYSLHITGVVSDLYIRVYGTHSDCGGVKQLCEIAKLGLRRRPTIYFPIVERFVKYFIVPYREIKLFKMAHIGFTIRSPAIR